MIITLDNILLGLEQSGENYQKKEDKGGLFGLKLAQK